MVVGVVIVMGDGLLFGCGVGDSDDHIFRFILDVDIPIVLNNVGPAP